MKNLLLSGLSLLIAALPLAAGTTGHPPQELAGMTSAYTSFPGAKCIAAGDNRTFHVVWYEPNGADLDICYRYFDGWTWSPKAYVTSNSSDSESPSLALDAEGILHLVWSDLEDGTYEIYYKARAGGVWSAATKLSGGGIDAETPVVAVDHAGNVHVVWREYRAGSWALYYRRFSGSIWSEKETLTPAGSYPKAPCIAADSEGNLHLVWQDIRISNNSEIYYRKYDGAAWGPEVRLTECEGLSEYPSVTPDSAGNLHVFWNDYRIGTSDIFHKICDAGVWGDDQLLASGAGNLIGPSCCADSMGRIFVVWYSRDSNSNGVYFKKFDGSAWYEPELVALSKAGALNPSVATDGDGMTGVIWRGSPTGVNGIWWRLYEELGLPPTLISVDPFSLGADESTPLTITGASFRLDMQAWLSAGEDSIPLLNVTTLSSTSMTAFLDPGPMYEGNWDFVISTFPGARDTLAGFLIEATGWEPDVRLTDQAGDSKVAGPNARTIAVDSQGNAHVVWCDSRDGKQQIYYKRCEAGIWGPDTRLSDLTNAAKAPAIAVDGADRLHVVWTENPLGNWEIYYRRWDGSAWGAAIRLTVSMGTSEYPAIAATQDSTLYVVWDDDRRSTGNFDIYMTHFNGTDWRPDTLVYDGALRALAPAIVADSRGDIHLAWSNGGDIGASLVHRKICGSSWEPPETLAVGNYICDATIAAGFAGSIHLVWEGGNEIYYRRFDGSAWGTQARISDGLNSSRNPSVVATPGGFVRVFWADGRWGSNEIFQAHFDGTAWSTNARLTVASDDSDEPSAAWGSNGNLHVVWQDRRDGNYEIYYKMWEAGASSGIDPEAQENPIGRGVSSLVAGPNPARSGTMLRFSVLRGDQVRISVYDIFGKLIWCQESGKKEPGRYEVLWDGCDSSGRPVSPGIYFARITSGRESAEAKIVVVK